MKEKIKVMQTKTGPRVTIRLDHVRLSFPALFEPKAFDDSQEPKYSATFLMDKEANKADIDALNKGIDIILKDKYPKGRPKGLKVCLRDGSEKPDLDGYGPDVMFTGANNAQPVPVVDGDLTPLDERSGRPYSGCYVNAVILLWPQDNKWGKRVNAQLRTVQFVEDGDPFGTKTEDPHEVFEPVAGKSDEDSDVDDIL